LNQSPASISLGDEHRDSDRAELSSNFDAYKANLKAGAIPQAAAENTFTGTMASRAGFTKARIIIDTKSKVVVEFSR
jgi:hypothetical protein